MHVAAVLFALAAPLVTPLAPAQAAELRWQAAESDVDRMLANYLADSNIVSDVLTLLGQNLEASPPLLISIGSGENGSRQPSFSLEDGRIRLPYAYFEDAIRAQAQLGDAPPGEGWRLLHDAPEEGHAVRAALDMLEYTLYHLIGHALVQEGSADADEAAEAISTWLMIQGWPNGAQQWLESSRAFGAASQHLDGGLDVYWHGHALYALRERTMACWALGADPVTIEPLLAAVTDPGERRERCARSWRLLDERVRALLSPVLVPDAPLLGDAP